MLCDVCAAGHSTLASSAQFANIALQSIYYYNLTIWYYQATGGAGIVLSGGISGSNSPQVRSLCTCLQALPDTPYTASHMLCIAVMLAVTATRMHKTMPDACLQQRFTWQHKAGVTCRCSMVDSMKALSQLKVFATSVL